MIHLFALPLLILPISSYVLDEVKDLQTTCRGPQGITCHCRLALLPVDQEDVLIIISSCFRRGGWSDWSSWSGCSAGKQRRRRACTRPTPIGKNSSCEGSRLELRPCSEIIPEYFWGRWTSWAEWDDCDCRRSTRIRSRRCLGRSCEGCDTQTAACSCPQVRSHSPWTRWLPSRSEEHRFRAVAISQVSPLASEVEEERRTSQPVWTEWEIRRGVALRYQNSSTCLVDSRLLVLSVDYSRVPVVWLLYTSASSLVIGFLTQCCLSHCCHQKRRPGKLNYPKF